MPTYLGITDVDTFFEMIEQHGYSTQGSRTGEVVFEKKETAKDTLVRLTMPRKKRIRKTSSQSSQDSHSRKSSGILRQRLKELRDINARVGFENEQLRSELDNQEQERQETFENLIRLLFVVAYHHDKKLFRLLDSFLVRRDFVTYPEGLSLNQRSISRFVLSFVFKHCHKALIQDSILAELKQIFLGYFESKGSKYSGLIELFTIRRTEECEISNSSNKKEPKFTYRDIEPLSIKDLKLDTETREMT